ncbi:MAG: alpha-L-fucosidase [Deltaproteobacteria bacterium]|nr:alpha-L-fucosidase [Deltaproteobacteria bacterium]
MLQLMADYYQAVPEGVVNDRWMHQSWVLRLMARRPVQRTVDALVHWKIRRDAARGTYSPGIVPPPPAHYDFRTPEYPPPAHYDFRTPEYTSFDEIRERKWEATRGMSPSFGFNRADTEADYEDPAELVRSFVDSVAKNGNLLLNVGPRGDDASIPEPQRSRLDALGAWLEANGEAIYGTRPWVVADAETPDGVAVRFTSKGGVVFATLLATPRDRRLVIPLPAALPGPPQVRHLATGVPVAARLEGSSLHLDLEAPLADAPAHSFALTGR